MPSSAGAAVLSCLLVFVRGGSIPEPSAGPDGEPDRAAALVAEDDCRMPQGATPCALRALQRQARRLSGAEEEAWAAVGTLIYSRHGLRPVERPPPGGEDRTNGQPYSDLTFPGAAEWGMHPAEFEFVGLTPTGHQLLYNLGKYVRHTNPLLNSEAGMKDLQIQVVADDSHRDVQSAEDWIRGFGPEAGPVTVAYTGTPLRDALWNAHAKGDCKMLNTKELVEMMFGDNLEEMQEDLMATYGSLIDKVNDVIECCSENLCYANGLQTNCTLRDLPWVLRPHAFWEGLYSLSPLNVAGYFSEVFMMQAGSGLEVAWGRLSLEEVKQLYLMHLELMGSLSNHLSRPLFSAMLAYILVSFEQLVSQEKQAGLVQPPSSRSLIAMFAHDMEIHGFRHLFGARWKNSGWPRNMVPAGSYLELELQKSDRGNYRVQGYMVAPTLEQQRSNSTFLSPDEPPSRAHFLSMPYEEFRRHSLGVVDRRCVFGPLGDSLSRIANKTFQHLIR